jgi:ATP-dependent Clp protease ATP-binding subunit ClpX
MGQVQPEDLVKFGLIPEFIGRLPVVAVLDELTESDLVRVLTQPRNALFKQYRRLLAMEGVELLLDSDVPETIAREALKMKTGARALRSLLEKVMLEIFYTIPSDPHAHSITLTRDSIRSGLALPPG